MRQEDKSDYILRATHRFIAKAIKPLKIFGVQYKWEDGDGRIRVGRIKQNPNPVPAPTPNPTPNPEPLPQPVPSGVVLGRIRHDYEMNGLSRPENLELELGHPLLNAKGQLVMGLPETVKALDSRGIPLNKKYQFLWFDALKKANPGMSDEDLVNLFRVITRSNAFKTNGMAPPRAFANFVTGEGLQYEPMKTEVILTGGAIVELVDYPNTVRIGGKIGYAVKMINTYYPAPTLDDFDGLHQTATVFFATTSQRVKTANGTRRVIPLTGGPNIACISVARADYAVFDANRIEVLTDGILPSPYNY